MSGLGLRRRLLLVVLATVVVVVAGLVAGFNLVLGTTLDSNAHNLVRARAAAQLASLRVEHGRLAVGEAPDDRSADAYLWVFAGTHPLEQPRAAPDVERAVHGLIGGHRATSTSPRRHSPLCHAGDRPGKRVGTVVAGVSLAPYEETRGTALIASIVFGALVLVLLGVVSRWLLGASLRPVVA